MKKSTKYTLCGIGTFVLVLVGVVLIRYLTKGIAIEEGFRNVSTWLIGAASGVCSAWAGYNKACEKEAKAAKEKKDNE